jgi:hypothetical protein
VLAPARCAEMDMNSLMRRVPEWISCHPVAQAAIGEHEIENIYVVYGEEEQSMGGQITYFGFGKEKLFTGKRSSSQYGRSLILALSTKQITIIQNNCQKIKYKVKEDKSYILK